MKQIINVGNNELSQDGRYGCADDPISGDKNEVQKDIADRADKRAIEEELRQVFSQEPLFACHH